MAELLLTDNFTTINCGKPGCHMQFAVPASVERKWRQTGETWYCPNGHARCFNKSTEEQRLRDELASVKRSKEYLEADLRSERERAKHFKHSAAITRGKHRKLKERIAAGLCPCCRRPFANLMAHMQRQHPTYRPTEGNKDDE